MKKYIITLLLLFNFQLSRAQTANSLSFDGTNDLVNLGTDSAFAIGNAAITLEAWIYATAWKTWVYEGDILVKEENTSNLGYMLRAGEGGKLNFAVGNGSWNELTTKAGTLSLNTWTHIAATYDGKYSRVYVNGKIVDSLSVNITIGQSYTTPLVIGNHSGTYSRYWQGNIDEVRIWNIVRSSQEIANYYQSEFCALQKGLVAYYKFNQGKAGGSNASEKTLIDYSGNKRNGMLSGFALSGSSSNWVSGKKLGKSASNDSFSLTRCDRYTVPSKSRTIRKSGIYFDTIPSWLGCDSALKINLTILPTKSITQSLWICDSIASPSGGGFYKKTGIYVDLLRTYQGCDSTVTTVLKVGSDTGYVKASACYFWKSPSGKYIYTQTGYYKDTIKNMIGCDSIISVDVNIKKPTFSKIQLKTCYKPVKSLSGMRTYTTPGTYFDTLVNKSGCDSIIEVKFEYSRSFSTVNLTGCRGVWSPSGKKYFTQNGTYLDTIMNRAFCDSVITLNVKIIPSSSNEINLSGCRQVISPLKNRSFKSSGKYTDTLKNYLGCDSVITWNVTVTHVNKEISLNTDTKTYTAATTSGTFQWLDCKNGFQQINGAVQRNFTPATNGYYGVSVTQNSCTDTSLCLIVSGVFTDNHVNKVNIKIFPQPSSGTFYVTSNASLSNTQWSIMSLSGDVIEAKRIQFSDDNTSAEFFLNVAPGLYFLHVIFEDGNGWNERFVIGE